MSSHEASIAAIYAIARAKDYVEGVGGRTDAVVLNHKGRLEPVLWQVADSLEPALRLFDSQMQEILLSLLTHDDSSFRRSLDNFKTRMDDIRVRFGLDKDNQALFRKMTDRIAAALTEVSPSLQSTTRDPQPPLA